MSGLWHLTYVPSDWTVRGLHRAWLVSFLLSAAAMLAILIAIGSNLVFHRRLFGSDVVFVLTALAPLPPIFRQSLRVRMAVLRGNWTRRGLPVTRSEQPRRFWFWTV